MSSIFSGARRAALCLVTAVIALFLGACFGGGSGGSSGSGTPTPEITVRSITITPQTASFAAGTTVQFTATAEFSDGTTRDVTGEAVWSSSDTAVVTIANAGDSSGDAAGLARGQAPGNAVIRVSFGGAASETPSGAITVTAAFLTEIQVSPQDPNLPKGLSQQFTAIGIFSDGSSQDITSEVDWTSQTPAVASIDANGLATTVAEGSTLITAASGSLSDDSTLTVTAAVLSSVDVTPANATIPNGRTQQFAATGIFSDGSTVDLTTSATWTSSNTGVATVDSGGLASSQAVGGPVSITATFDGESDAGQLTVSAAVMTALDVTPNSSSVPAGLTKQFVATATFSDNSTQDVSASATWTSSDTDVATIDATALATGRVAGGPVTLTASLSGFEDTAELTVTAAILDSISVAPANAEIPDGTTRQYAATGIYSDGSTQNITSSATWASSDRDIADISNVSGTKGLALGRSPGTVDITASLSGKVGTTQLTVTDAVLTNIQVSPNNAKLANGFERQFSAQGTFSDNTTQDITEQATWSSNDESVATVSNAAGEKGLVTADAANTGTLTISASLSGKTGNALLTVTSATLTSITVSPDPASTHLDPDVRVQFTAQGNFSDSTTQDLTTQVTWSSDNTAVATVSNASGEQGQAAPVSTGVADIVATLDTISGSSELTVTDAELEQITVTPVDAIIPAGRSQLYTAIGTYSDNTSSDITTEVVWASSNSNVSIVSGATDGGKATSNGAAAGQTSDITATLDDIISNTAVLTVSDKVLDSITVETNPQGATSTAAGNEVTYTATGNYSDGSAGQLSSDVSWSIIEELPVTPGDNVADIALADNGEGLLSTFNAGKVRVRAAQGSIAGDSNQLEVTQKELSSVDVTPTNPTIPLSNQQQFVATAHYTDGSTENVTTNANTNWSSEFTTVATIDNTSKKGLATSMNPGDTLIQASFQDQLGNARTGSTTLTVAPASLVLIEVTAETLNLPVGFDVQFTATGTFSDESTRDITSEVTWATFSGNAEVSNVDGSKGLVTAVTAGGETLSASLGSVTGSTDLTVTNATLVSIAVTPANESAAINELVQYTATGTFSDASKLDITEQVTWSSSNTTVATISNAGGSKGEAQARFVGDTTISARRTESDPDIVGSTTLTVVVLKP